MAHTLTICGVTGSLKWGYHLAGSLSAWTVSRADNRTTLTGALDQGDTFRLSQRPLVFEAPHAKGAWRWPITELQITGASLTAVLGPKE